MLATNDYNGGENFDLRDILLKGRKMSFHKKLDFFSEFIKGLTSRKELHHMRCITSAADRQVDVIDSYTGHVKPMLMFGSNNYIGLANHPYVKEYVTRIINKFGVGIGGPPLLNGYTILHKELEERLAALKGCEDALIFSSGYGANVGLITALLNNNDLVIYDKYSHASFTDGLKMSGTQGIHFPHNDVEELEKCLARLEVEANRNIFVGIEGVYSMDGDIAPLDKIVPMCKPNNAILILDDAHGTGVMGKCGRGTAEHFGLDGEIDISMGTFSKTFGASGGFVAASKPVINYLRFFARSYMFSASAPPTVIASVLAGLDVLENEPELLKKLKLNIEYTSQRLDELDFENNSLTPIFPLKVPEGMNIREAAFKFHQRGIFLNSIEYPAVPVSQQRFRISIMATHTKEDIDRLITAIEEIWNENKQQKFSEQSFITSNKAIVN
jgi:glycine C-acetyltransferase